MVWKGRPNVFDGVLKWKVDVGLKGLSGGM